MSVEVQGRQYNSMNFEGREVNFKLDKVVVRNQMISRVLHFVLNVYFGGWEGVLTDAEFMLRTTIFLSNHLHGKVKLTGYVNMLIL